MDREDQLKIAQEIVDEGPIDLESKIPGAKEIGEVWALTGPEIKQFGGFRRLITGYLAQTKPKCPLCLAVFGPPGSGKTTSVKAVRAAVEEAVTGWRNRLPLYMINLTQVPDARALGLRLDEIVRGVREREVPFILFDEFDAPRAGTPLGWLSWFLSAMNDGEWVVDSQTGTLHQAIYVFAGGTAHQFADFGVRKSRQFDLAKGPDFVSRLRGYLDVQGVNDSTHAVRDVDNPTYTEIRRAVVLHSQLTKQAKYLGLPDDEHIELTPDFRDALLSVGRYRHGGRSIEAIVEMTARQARLTKPSTNLLDFKHLPAEHLLSLHRDRGVLDPAQIGGCIQLSGGGASRGQREMRRSWRALALALWRTGATLAYGGRAVSKNPKEENLTSILSKEAKTLPLLLWRQRPSKLKYGEVPDLLRVRCFTPAEVGQTKTVARRPEPAVQIESVPGLNADEQQNLNEVGNFRKEGTDWNTLAQSIVLFRARLQIAEECIATVAIGGKGKGYKGRFPGVAEEIALALFLQHPIYLCGNPDEDTGVARGLVGEIGGILGLQRPWVGNPQLLVRLKNRRWSDFFDGPGARWKDLFRPPPYGKDLPLTPKDLLELLRDRAVGGPKWPNNGLSPSENRQLFSETDPEKAAKLVVQGLSRRFGSV